MSRLHTHKHGKSHSTRPINVRMQPWIFQKSDEIVELIKKYGKDNLSSSQIGIKLRDQHAIPLAKPLIKKSITQILDENKLNKDIPEDLTNIVKKAIGLQRHLQTNKSDKRNIRSLELIEAKIHRLSEYYKKINKLEKNWKYKSIVAQLE
ncbi:MAG: 30S ribosomal protein S15 [Nitrosopumilaceae archaeon]|nr:30S ribosomal protein S15 [Nitrosopumilaceae archaeon]